MKSCIFFLFFSLVSFLTLSAQTQFTTADSNQITKLLSEYPIDQTPGLAVSITVDGEEIYQAQKGYANLEHKVPITSDTRFLVGSISKQFTCFAILLLEQEGLLSIDSNVMLYIPELQNLKQDITLRQLMTHTSGYRNTGDLTSITGRSESDQISFREVVDLILRQRSTNYRPGDRFQYCNSSYIILAEVVSRVSGQSFSAFVQERILTPLEMTNSQFVEDDGTVIKNKANSYQKLGDEYRFIPMNRPFVGSTGLWTTAQDLGRWASNFHQMKIGEETLITKMRTRGQLNNGQQLPYALGQEIKDYKGLEVVFHGGGDAGYRAYLLRVPKYKLSVAIMGNFEVFNPLNMAYGLIDVALAEYITNQPIDIPIYKTADLEKYTGTYQVFPGLYMNILAENDTLYLQEFGTNGKAPLPVSGSNEFNFPYRAQSRIKFFPNGFNWHFSDFYYPSQKVTLNPPVLTIEELSIYTGLYYSTEVDTYYEIVIKDGQLVATHNINRDVVLSPIAKDAFITRRAFTGRFEFTSNAEGEVIECRISGQSAWGIRFQKR